MLAITSTVISLIAVGISAIVFAEGRTRHKRDMFLRIQETMISEESYRGRQLLLSQAFTEKSINDLDHSRRAEVSRTLALFDTMGMYLDRGYLVEDDVLTMWGTRVVRVWNAAQPFIRRRERQTPGIRAYPYFQHLVERAQKSGLDALDRELSTSDRLGAIGLLAPRASNSRNS